MLRRALALLAIAGFGTPLSCGKCGGADALRDAAPSRDVASAVPSGPSSSPPADARGPAPPDGSTPAVRAAATLDAGASDCRLAYGPAEQPFRGPAAIVVAPGELRLVTNDSGKPRVYPVPVGAPPAPNAPVPASVRPSTFVGVRWPPCEMAGKWAYCQAPGGVVYRTTLGGEGTRQIAKSRPGTRIAAVALGGDHAVVATLESRRTTEGEMLQAFATLDEGETVRLSEDGAGATVVRLVPRGDRALAVYLDTRTAMVPVHARPVSVKNAGDLALGDDAVVFVAGPPERGVDFGVVGTREALFALLPISRETSDFGMAAIPLGDPPKDDAKPVWSLYPNGLDPAPIAGITRAGAAGERHSYLARVRPEDAVASSPRVLELGRIDAGGVFTSLGPISAGKRITDIAMATDSFGSVWILYGDSAATWLERRVCP